MSPWLYLAAMIILPIIAGIIVLLWRLVAAFIVGCLVLGLVLSPILVPMWLYQKATYPDLNFSEIGNIHQFSEDSAKCLQSDHSGYKTADECFQKKIAYNYCDTEACLDHVEKLCTEVSCRSGVNLRRLEIDISQAKLKVREAKCPTAECVLRVAREVCKFDECVKPAVIDICASKLGAEEGLNCYAMVGVVYQSKPASQWFESHQR